MRQQLSLGDANLTVHLPGKQNTGCGLFLAEGTAQGQSSQAAGPLPAIPQAAGLERSRDCGRSKGDSSSQSISQGRAQPPLPPLSIHALQGPATSGSPGDEPARVLAFPQAASAGAACLHPQNSQSGWLSGLGADLRVLMGSRAAQEVWLCHQGPSPVGDQV